MGHELGEAGFGGEFGLVASGKASGGGAFHGDGLDEGDYDGAEQREDKEGDDEGGGFFAGGLAVEGVEEFAHGTGAGTGWMA